jgi:hypothetical protein
MYIHNISEINQIYMLVSRCKLLGGGIKRLSVEEGFIPAFGIGIPLAVLGYLSFLRRETIERKKFDEGVPSYGKQDGRKIKKYTADGKPVYE